MNGLVERASSSRSRNPRGGTFQNLVAVAVLVAACALYAAYHARNWPLVQEAVCHVFESMSR